MCFMLCGLSVPIIPSGCERSPSSPSSPSAGTPSASAAGSAERAAAALWSDLLSTQPAALNLAIDTLAEADRARLRAAVYTAAEGDGVRAAETFIPMIPSFRDFATRFKAAAERLEPERRAACYAGLDALFAGLMRSGEALPGKYKEEQFTAWALVATWRLWTLQELEQLGEAGAAYTPKQTAERLDALRRHSRTMVTGDGVP